MAAGFKTRGFNHRIDFLTQQRDFARRLVIGDRGQQTDEQMFPDHGSVRVKLLDRDRIHMDTTMNGRAIIGFGDTDQIRRAHLCLNLGRQSPQIAQPIENKALRVLQDSQSAVLYDVQSRFFPGAVIVDFTVAHERKMVIMQPFQEGCRL